MQTFNFLGSVINDKNVNCAEILTRIKKGNKVFFMNKKLLSPKLNRKESKVKIYTGCPRRKGPNFRRVFLRSNYTDITQNTYIQSSMVTEILNIEK